MTPIAEVPVRLQTKVALAVGGALAVVIAFLLVDNGNSEEPKTADTPEEQSLVVRDDSRVLGESGSSDVTLVEFLDFECEACRAYFPIIEQLREDYAGEITFVARYFPLPGHFNSFRAAQAVESAARQGEFEAMYQKMYETQTTWSEARVAKDEVFRGFAQDLGLDMEQFDADYASIEVQKRVQQDVDDGTELGVGGTPTFYLNGQPIQPRSAEEFTQLIDAELAQ